MIHLTYKDKVYSVQELSEMSGIAEATIRDRLRRGYTAEEAVRITPMADSVKEFCNASYYLDWVGLSTAQLHEVYWKWCVGNGYSPLQIKGFTRQVMKMYPNLKTVPTKKEHGSCRIIRER
jgi:hypothetical protein